MTYRITGDDLPTGAIGTGTRPAIRLPARW